MRLFSLFLLAATAFLPSAARGAVEYTVVNLSAEWDAEFPQPEIVQTWHALAINNSGQVAGYGFKVDNSGFALMWDSNNGLRDFSDMEGPTTTYCINNLGQIAVHGYPGDFLWDGNTGPQQIIGWGTGPLSTVDINDLGQVVGSHWPDSNLPSAFFWNGGIAQEIGNLGGEWAGATAINNLGQAVGWSKLPDGTSHAFLWDSVNGTSDLGDAGLVSIARDINDNGQIIGNAQLEADGDLHTVIWEDGEETIDLDILIGESFSVTAINNLGHVIGSTRRLVDDGDPLEPPQFIKFASIWDSDRGLRILDDLLPPELGWHIVEIHGINDSGWIVGSGFKEDLQLYYQVILKPVPEPSCLVMIIGALTVFSFNFLRSHYRKGRAL